MDFFLSLCPLSFFFKTKVLKNFFLHLLQQLFFNIVQSSKIYNIDKSRMSIRYSHNHNGVIWVFLLSLFFKICLFLVTSFSWVKTLLYGSSRLFQLSKHCSLIYILSQSQLSWGLNSTVAATFLELSSICYLINTDSVSICISLRPLLKIPELCCSLFDLYSFCELHVYIWRDIFTMYGVTWASVLVINIQGKEHA